MKEITLKAMPILSEPSYRYHILPDGSMVDVYDVIYTSKVDIEKHLYISMYDEGYDECDICGGFYEDDDSEGAWIIEKEIIDFVK